MSRETLRARLARATPGPWFHYKAARLRKQFSGPPVDEVSVGPGGPTVIPWSGFGDADGTQKSKRANAALIAHARQDLPALLAVADAAAAVRDTFVGPPTQVNVRRFVSEEALEALYAALAALEALP